MPGTLNPSSSSEAQQYMSFTVEGFLVPRHQNQTSSFSGALHNTSHLDKATVRQESQ